MLKIEFNWTMKRRTFCWQIIFRSCQFVETSFRSKLLEIKYRIKLVLGLWNNCSVKMTAILWEERRNKILCVQQRRWYVAQMEDERRHGTKTEKVNSTERYLLRGKLNLMMKRNLGAGSFQNDCRNVINATVRN